MKILLVDDSAFMRSLIKNILKTSNHEIFEAGNADEALKTYSECHPDLVFMDIIMPGKNGIEALKDIKNVDGGAYVVMCSSVGGQQKIIDEAMSAGAIDFVTKPFKSEEISKILSNVQNTKR